MRIENNTSEKASAIETYIRQSNIFCGLQERFMQKTMSHGYLFTGGKGTGKYAMAILFAQMFFCSEKDKPCGYCRGCLKVKHHSHPDVIEISGESSIGVGQIRQTIQKVGEHTYEGGYRFILIDDAHKMTSQAQNALLKTLEDPYENVIFCLLATEKQLLLPTVLSRVQLITVPQATDDEMFHFLNSTGLSTENKEKLAYFYRGELSAALEYAKDDRFFIHRQQILEKVLAIDSYYALHESAAFYKEEKDRAEIFFKTLEELVRIALFVSLDMYPQRVIADYPKPWIKMVKSKQNNKYFLELINKTLKTKQKYLSQVNWQAILEELFAFIMEENKRWQQ